MGEGERETQVDFPVSREPDGAQTHDPAITTSAEIKSCSLNALSHPGGPKHEHFFDLSALPHGKIGKHETLEIG